MTETDTTSNYTDYDETTLYVDPDDSSTKKIDSRIRTTTMSSTIPSTEGNDVEKEPITTSKKAKKAKKAEKSVLLSKMGDADPTSEPETTKEAFRFGKV